MSSPAPLSPPSALNSTSTSNQKTPQEQITFRFCRECSNMLYPKEDRMTSKLMFACRTCQFSEEAQSSCVFRNNMYNTVGETAGVTQDVGSDPTVGGFDFECCEGEGWWSCTFCGRVFGGGEEEGNYRREMEIEEMGEEDVKTARGGMIDVAEMSRREDKDTDLDEEEVEDVEQNLDDAEGNQELKTPFP